MSDIQPTSSSLGGNLARGAAVVGAVAAAGLLTSRRANALALNFADSIPGTGDIKVLNYALALEDFEAAFYIRALAKLPSLGAGTGNALFNYIQEFSQVETDHATFLRAAITSAGGPVISKFNYDYSGIDNATTAQAVLELILQLEATGVRAYIGAVPFLSSKSAYLQTAAAIQGTEARHTSVLTIVRNQLFGPITPVAPLPQDGNDTTKFNYDSVGYRAAAPNEGYKGIDVALSPNAVLTAVGPFFVSPIAAG